MGKIIILTESGSDINQEIAAKYNLEIIPMHVALGNENYDDGFIEPKKIIDYYRQTRELPKTSGCSIYDFQVILDKIHGEHPNAEILYMAHSELRSCSYQNALQVAGERNYFYVMDTLSATLGQASIVMRTAEILQAHPEYTVKQLIAEAQELVRRSHFAFVPDTLEFLCAGGRVSNMSYFTSSILKIHPLIDEVDGSLIGIKRYRGSMLKLIPTLIKEYTAKYNLEKDRLWFIYTEGFTDDQKKVADSTANQLGFKKIVWIKAGAVITAQGGPGTFGIAGFSAE